MTKPLSIPQIRLQVRNAAPVAESGEYVLYWMIAFRRLESNFSLQRAVEWAEVLGRPLVIFEPLRIGYRWACDRIHRFVIDGMADNAAGIAARNRPGVLYYPYVEPTRDADKGLLFALAERACVIVTDEFPCFFVPRMIAAVAPRLPVRLEQVDSNGMLPLRGTDRVFSTAFSFRAFLQKELPNHLTEFPAADPLRRIKLPPLETLPEEITGRRSQRNCWPETILSLARWPSTIASAFSPTEGGRTRPSNDSKNS
jgi:deoxyribodipyrimidine photo-lyase